MLKNLIYVSVKLLVSRVLVTSQILFPLKSLYHESCISTTIHHFNTGCPPGLAPSGVCAPKKGAAGGDRDPLPGTKAAKGCNATQGTGQATLAKPLSLLQPDAAGTCSAAGCRGWESPAGDQPGLLSTTQVRNEVAQGPRLPLGLLQESM